MAQGGGALKRAVGQQGALTSLSQFVCIRLLLLRPNDSYRLQNNARIKCGGAEFINVLVNAVRLGVEEGRRNGLICSRCFGSGQDRLKRCELSAGGCKYLLLGRGISSTA